MRRHFSAVREPVIVVRPSVAAHGECDLRKTGFDAADVLGGAESEPAPASGRELERGAAALPRALCPGGTTAKSVMRLVKWARDLTRLSHSHIANCGPKIGARAATNSRRIGQLRKRAPRPCDRGCYISLLQTLGLVGSASGGRPDRARYPNLSDCELLGAERALRGTSGGHRCLRHNRCWLGVGVKHPSDSRKNLVVKPVSRASWDRNTRSARPSRRGTTGA
jgi:hypothetical protein